MQCSSIIANMWGIRRRTTKNSPYCLWHCDASARNIHAFNHDPYSFHCVIIITAHVFDLSSSACRGVDGATVAEPARSMGTSPPTTALRPPMRCYYSILSLLLLLAAPFVSLSVSTTKIPIKLISNCLDGVTPLVLYDIYIYISHRVLWHCIHSSSSSSSTSSSRQDNTTYNDINTMIITRLIVLQLQNCLLQRAASDGIRIQSAIKTIRVEQADHATKQKSLSLLIFR